MKEETNLYNLLKNYENKKGILILTKSNFKYITDNLLVNEDSISFTDVKGDIVLLAFSQIAQVTKKEKQE